MFRGIITKLAQFDWYLIINILLLMFFGLAAIYSLQLNVPNPDLATFQRQIIFVVVGLILFIMVSLINYHFWGDYYKLLLILMILVLISLFISGTTIRGIRGWLTFFGQTIQPVEFAKLVLVVFLSKYLSLKGRGPTNLTSLAVSSSVTLIMVILVAVQPDLGSAMILFLTWLILVMLLPLSRKRLVSLILIILLIGVGSWFTLLKDYQQTRLITFLNPQADPLGAGYNVTQAMLAVGAGQIFGRGLSLGSQSQLNFLPEQETDFIFAVIAEEMGFLGASLILFLFFTLCFRIYQISRNYSDDFGNLLALGILIYLAVQIFINIGMNLAIAPIAGIPLPLISAGGSSLISTLLAMGIIHSIYLTNRKLLFGKR